MVNQKGPNIYDKGGQEAEDCLQPIVVTLPGCVVSKDGCYRGRGDFPVMQRAEWFINPLLQ